MSNASSKPSAKSPAHAPVQVPAPAKVPWNPALALILTGFVILVLPNIVLEFIALYPQLKHWDTDQTINWFLNSAAAQSLYIFVTAALTVGGIHLFLRRYRRTLRDIGLLRPRWRDLVYGLLAVPVYYGFYILSLIVAVALFPGLDINQKQEIGFDQVSGLLNLILAFVSLVLIPPFMEEILMRGFLYTSLRKVMSVLWAALVTSVVFAVAHLQEGGQAGPLYVAAVDTFVLSLVLVYLREKTGSLWASMTLHAAKNSVAFMALFIAGVR